MPTFGFSYGWWWIQKPEHFIEYFIQGIVLGIHKITNVFQFVSTSPERKTNHIFMSWMEELHFLESTSLKKFISFFIFYCMAVLGIYFFFTLYFCYIRKIYMFFFSFFFLYFNVSYWYFPLKNNTND